MAQTQDGQIVDILNAWMAGSALADDLIAQTQALIARLAATKPPKCQTSAGQPIDTSTLSDAELFAYYKRIGLREDVRFFLAHAKGMPDSTYREASALLAELETRKSAIADRKRYHVLTDEWRRAQMDEEHAQARRIAEVSQMRIMRKLARARTRQAA